MWSAAIAQVSAGQPVSAPLHQLQSQQDLQCLDPGREEAEAARGGSALPPAWLPARAAAPPEQQVVGCSAQLSASLLPAASPHNPQPAGVRAAPGMSGLTVQYSPEQYVVPASAALGAQFWYINPASQPVSALVTQHAPPPQGAGAAGEAALVLARQQLEALAASSIVSPSGAMHLPRRFGATHSVESSTGGAVP